MCVLYVSNPLKNLHICNADNYLRWHIYVWYVHVIRRLDKERFFIIGFPILQYTPYVPNYDVLFRNTP